MAAASRQQLPVGSVVNISDEAANVVIIGQFPVVENDGDKGYYDFVGVTLPIGYDAKTLLFFNKEDINNVIFLGYIDAAFQSFLKEADSFEKETRLQKLKASQARREQDDL
ncbi:DUF4176 domain-containing protein [Streptococcus pantholopis]|uniref:DUF4176 domain-containing protein n=1 Tax=Streptococcus pantholopis TaxID=1811193 RepID=A0A172Q500_9STRE|nr:DUF4176 domain-containing protein [Streptococcus pantholopis]AND78530.1 hypothetical protein A0O21_00095 [Streptococcus pantholopis]